MDKPPLDGWAMVICNPISGAGRGLRILKTVRRTLDRVGVAYSHEVSGARGEVAQLARSAVLAGCSTVIVIGGDGTFFEAVNGVIGHLGPESAAHDGPGPTPTVAVGLVQAGRGSDFGRSAGVPSDVQAACARLVAGRTTLFDLGHVAYRSFAGEDRRRFFANAAGLGFDAEVTIRANAGSRRFGGTVPYLSSLLRTLVSYRNKPMQISLDGDPPWQARANSFIVANGQYFGGGMKIAPDASLSDGLFDITMLGELGKIDLVRNVPRVYDGSHITHPKVTTARARTVQVDSPERLLLQADGEVLGLAPAHFTIVPSALKMII